ncbi:MAG: branched chain amino acid aminotransferase [Anaerolineaceae bacterium]|nr:MAG: branched chain amino acid aminotransferase [Anaerolineaceae bacterium]
MDQPQFAYFEGKIVPFGEAKVSVATHAFNYGTGVFGGLRGYWNEERKRLFVFRPWDHFHRLLHSARLLCMEVSHTEESLIQIMLDLLRAENWQRDVYLRPMFYKADAGIGVRLHNLKDDLTMWSVPFQKYIQNDTSAHATISSWRRIDDNVIPARGKISGAYVNSALAKTDAARAGFDEALTLDQNGHVSEGSAMNVFMVRDGTVITPPVTENILEGITRRSLLQLTRDELGLPVVERPIDRSETTICDEFFMAGTAAQVVAITKVDHRPIGNGVMGPVVSKLRDMFEEIVRGRNEKYKGWVTEV